MNFCAINLRHNCNLLPSPIDPVFVLIDYNHPMIFDTVLSRPMVLKLGSGLPLGTAKRFQRAVKGLLSQDISPKPQNTKYMDASKSSDFI